MSAERTRAEMLNSDLMAAEDRASDAEDKLHEAEEKCNTLEEELDAAMVEEARESS